MATEDPTPELWLPVRNYEGLYEVSDAGRVRSIYRVVGSGYKSGCRAHTKTWRGRTIKVFIARSGYAYVQISSSGNVALRLVHRLVLEAFNRAPEPGEQCNHKNFDKADNRLDNLEWCSPRENTAHAISGGRVTYVNGERHGHAKLTAEIVLDIRSRVARGEHHRALANEYQVSLSNISAICVRRSWPHV